MIMNFEKNHKSKDFKLTFEPFINYESIVCSYFPNSDKKINAACMGVHFTSTNEVYLHAYKDTHTKSILTPGVTFSINFSENFYEYVIAALRRKNHEELIDELPKKSFKELEPVPILKSVWCAVICEVIRMPPEMMSRPKCKRREVPNIRSRILSINVYRYPKIFNNRGMNLAIEALILATRIPIYNPLSNEYLESIKDYIKVKKKLLNWQDMDRFHDGFEVMDNFLINSGVEPQELFDF